jgi:hypothetical protein
MKIKVIILLAFAAIITLSFSFASSTPDQKVSTEKTSATTNFNSNEPAGGFISEDKL